MTVAAIEKIKMNELAFINYLKENGIDIEKIKFN